jgi:hypothetical protein
MKQAMSFTEIMNLIVFSNINRELPWKQIMCFFYKYQRGRDWVMMVHLTNGKIARLAHLK